MKNIFIILSIFLFSNVYALDLWGNNVTSNWGYNNPYYGLNNWNNNSRLLNNLRMLGYNSLIMPPLNHYSNFYPYPNVNNNLPRHPRYAHFLRHWNKFPRYPVGQLTGFTPPVTDSLPKCETNSYSVSPTGVISCNHEVKSSTTVRIIDD